MKIDATLQAFGDGTAYDPDEIGRAGAFVILGRDGVACVERGLIRGSIDTRTRLQS